MAELYGYKASVANSEDANEPWKPSIHMPKEAARIWIKVTDVRVERLQEITIDGIRKEGLSSMAVHAGDANPWAWVIEFERCEKPEGV